MEYLNINQHLLNRLIEIKHTHPPKTPYGFKKWYKWLKNTKK